MSSLMEHRNRPWVGAVLFIFLGAALVLGLSSDYFVRPICVALTRALHAACAACGMRCVTYPSADSSVPQVRLERPRQLQRLWQCDSNNLVPKETVDPPGDA
jgi:hypothetical protein